MSRHGPAVVLVPGAWHDATCWRAVEWHLSARRIPSASVELPSTDPVPGPSGLPGFAADVAAVLDRIDAVAAATGAPVVLCGHGYGGMVISEAGRHPAVARLVYLTALCPGPGESAVDLVPRWRPGRGRWRPVRLLGDGRAELTGRPARHLAAGRPGTAPGHRRWDAAGGCWQAEPSAGDVGRALRPFTAAVLGAAVREPAWLHVPTVHLRARHDPVLGRAKADAMGRRVLARELAREWPPTGGGCLPTGHHAMATAPALVARLLAEQCGALRTGGAAPPLPWVA